MISVNHVSKKFGRLQALNSISVDFNAGKSYALIGPNGSGKTTLIKSILGLVIPDSGDISVNNTPTRHQCGYRKSIGYMSQIGRYPDNMQIGQLLDMLRGIRADTSSLDEELIEAFQLNNSLHKRMHTLSGGTRQKVSAVLAFLFKPSILILDEPTAGLDPLSVEILKDKVNRERAQKKLMIITSHVMNDLDEMTSEVLYLQEGKILYHKSIEELKDVTGEPRLGKAIANMINSMSYTNNILAK